MNRLTKKIIAERGKDYYNENKSLLNAELEYIESLGDISDIKENPKDDIIISTPSTEK